MLVRRDALSHTLCKLSATILILGFIAVSAFGQGNQPPSPASAAPVSISLDEAIRRAEQNEPVFAAASAERRATSLDRSIATATLLPSVVYHNQVLYTQPNGLTNQGGQTGSQAAPIFIANNAVHEYASQASINETIGMRQVADVKAATAGAARAAAELEVARRGLVAAVVNLYYGVSNTQRRVALLKDALSEATAFTELT